MRKPNFTQEEAFEIIELTSNDFETLARAFDLINDLCGCEEEENCLPNPTASQAIH
ncbi:MAG: hypothetical protein SGJ02_02820 [bacterium]|nr:hypothetical protein [bacterium]